MTANRHAEVRRICQQALERPSAERPRFVTAACAGDESLQQEIETLLARAASAENFLATPAFDVEAELLGAAAAEARQALIGRRLGIYDIVALIASGGMGTVYRARDTKLGREVALKILPSEFAADTQRIARFTREAHLLASLNHPHVAAIYGLDEANGVHFLVLELVDGETLNTRVARRPIPITDALAIAKQVADALDAAHEKGIIHRDLKPANIALTKAGAVKVLDFGLAKATDPPDGEWRDRLHSPAITSPAMMTGVGVIVGTAAYMSPEQASGRTVDKRTDVWAFGCVLYEMLTGHRVFEGDTITDVIAGVIHKSPAWDALPRETPTGVRTLLQRCLAKDPAQRLRDIADARFDLDHASDSAAAPPMSRRRWLGVAATVIAGGLALFAGGRTLGRLSERASPPSYRLLTFTGKAMNARFAPDGQTLVYSAVVGDEALQVFSMRTDSTESRVLGIEDADVLAVSSRGEVAVLLRRRAVGTRARRGMLARVPLVGGVPRDILDDVQEADWSPDGSQLAVVRWVNGRNRLEYPIGHVLYETSGYLTDPRVSPDGQIVAFMDHHLKDDNRGWVAVVDLEGRERTLTAEWDGEGGLVWSRDGREVWFTAENGEEFDALHAVTLAGRQRVIARAPGYLGIHDLTRDGRALMTRDDSRTDVIGLSPGTNAERDLSWFNQVGLRDLSVDGATILFTNFVVGSPNYSVYVRKTDGSPAVRLGDGDACALSQDGQWVLAVLKSPSTLFMLPTGAGAVRPLKVAGIEAFDKPTRWVGGTARILFAGKEPGHNWRSYLLNVGSEHAQPVTPEGVIGHFVSPDGLSFVAEDPERTKFVYTLDATAAAKRLQLRETDVLSGWSADGRSIFVSRMEDRRIKILRFNPATQTEELVRETPPRDAAVLEGFLRVFVTPDGKSYVYQAGSTLADLYLVSGLR